MPTGVYRRSQEQLERLKRMSRMPKPLRGGGYGAIHKWLSRHYGKATRCVAENCKGTSKVFKWCLKSGCAYEHKRENFQQMCQTCHRSYDRTPEWDKSLSRSKTGEKNPRAVLTEKTVESMLLDIGELTAKEMADKYGVSYSAANQVVRGCNWKHVRPDIERLPIKKCI
mgnify:CR=1 FL=1